MKMKMLSADEKTAYYFFFVLDKIKVEINLQIAAKDPVNYIVVLHPALNDPYKPNSTTEQGIINKLIKVGVVTEAKEKSDSQILDYNSNNPKYASFTYYLKINDSSFNSLYQQYKKLVLEYETADTMGNTLIFYTNGKVEYISPQGKEYKTSFGAKTSQYALLRFLAMSPFQVFTFDALAVPLKKVKSSVDYSDNERRVRDTIKSIKDKIGYKEDDLFISDYGFGLNCNIYLKK